MTFINGNNTTIPAWRKRSSADPDAQYMLYAEEITIEESGTTIQSDALIGKNVIYILSSVAQVVVSDQFEFDPVTGTISDYPVQAGEIHIPHWQNT